MAMPKEEFSRKEQYYAAIAGRDGVKPKEQFSREEEWLNAIDEYLDTKANLVNGKVPASELPSYVDDVLEFSDKESFPTTGEAGKIYVALDTGKTYRWSGSTYVEVSTGEFEAYKLDMSNPEQWDAQENKPTDAVIEEIATHNYNAIRVDVEDDGIAYTMWLTAGSGANVDEADTHLRNFYKFDEGDEDEDEGQPPYIEQYVFLVQPAEEGEEGELEYIFAVDSFTLGGGSAGDIYYEEVNSPVSETRVTLDLEAISDAISNGKEIIIMVNPYSGYPDHRYFRMTTTPSSQQWIEDLGKLLWTPSFSCTTIDHEYTMVFDEYDNGSFYFNIVEGGRRFTPLTIDSSNNEITFDVDDYTYMWNFQPNKMTVNISETSNDSWVEFHKAYFDDLNPGSEALYYFATMPVVDNGAAEVYTEIIRLYMSNGNVATDYYVVQSGGSVPA